MQDMKFVNVNRKGLSDVVGMTILIFMSIAAIVVVAIFVNSLINPVSLSAKIDCADLQMQGAIKINSVCYNRNTNETELMIQRSLDSEIYSLEFSISSDDNSAQFKCDSSCLNCRLLSNGETKRYYFATADPNSIAIKSGKCVLASADIADC